MCYKREAIFHDRVYNVLTTSGKEVVKSVSHEVVQQLLHQPTSPLSPNPLYSALRLLYSTNESGVDTDIELLQAELLLQQSHGILSDATLSFIRGVLFSQQEYTLKRRMSNYMTLNPTFLDVCRNIPTLSMPFLSFFNNMVVEKATLEEVFQSSLADCLKRCMQKNKDIPIERLMKYIKYMDRKHMGPDTINSVQVSLTYFLKQHEWTDKNFIHLYRLCVASLSDPYNPVILSTAFKEVRQIRRTTVSLSDHLKQSFESFVIAALYETFDNNTSFVEEILDAGLKYLRAGDYDSVRKMLGDTPLLKLKPLLLAMVWDSVENHRDQTVLLEELSYNTGPHERLEREIFSSVRDQVEVGRWCEEQVKPLLRDSWDAAAASTLTSFRSILQVILALNCIQKLGQDKVLALMFNSKEQDMIDANDLPLSNALNLDQGRDIVTFCSAMIILNIISWLKKRCTKGKDESVPDVELILAEKHLSRVFPLYNRAQILRAAFSALVHALKQPKCGLTLEDCGALVKWFETQLEQLNSDETAMSLGHFDTVKIFRDLSVDAPEHHIVFQEIKNTVSEAAWRIDLLGSLTRSKSRKRRELNRLLSSSILSFLSSTPQDLLRLCLMTDNTEKAIQTLQKYDMKTTHLARVVEFQNDYAKCTKELEKFGVIIKKQQRSTAKAQVLEPIPANCIPQTSPANSNRGRSHSLSSTSSSINSSISMAPSIINVPATLRGVASAAAKSAERSKVPAIVSKLTSTVAKDQLMIESENFHVDMETLIARLLADLGCAISAPKTVGLQLISLALDRLKDTIIPDSPIEIHIKKLHSVMKMLDGKPYPGISVATSSPREFLNSIYPCVSHEVLQDLLDFNENQAVTYTDLMNAVTDKGPLDVVRMAGALESARDVLNENNYTTFLSTHDKHRDYLGSLIAYLNEYVKQFNVSLGDTPQEVKFYPSDIMNQSPQYHMGELVLKNNIDPRSLVGPAEYVSVDMLQLLIMSSFPHICIEEVTATVPRIAYTKITSEPETDLQKAAVILTELHRICDKIPKDTPMHVLMIHLENSHVLYQGITCSGMDLLRLLTDSISHHKAISALKPSQFDPVFLLGLLLQDSAILFEEQCLVDQVKAGCKYWLGTHAFINTDRDLQLSFHPLALIALVLMSQKKKSQQKGYLRDFFSIYTQIVCEFIGYEIETEVECPRSEITVHEDGGEFYLVGPKKEMKIIVSSCFNFKFISTCRKCKDIENNVLFRSNLKPLTPAFNFVKAHSDCLATLGYMINALHPDELNEACVIIDDSLFDYQALQQHVALAAGRYFQNIDNDIFSLMKGCHDLDQDIIGCHLFGGKRSRFLVHMFNCLLEYNLMLDQHTPAFDILSSNMAAEIYGEKVPDLILLLAQDKRDAAAPDFLEQFLKMEDKLLGLEFVRQRYEDWPVSMAMECFTYFSEVLEGETDCVSMIVTCLDRLNTMRRISKILKSLDIELETCRSLEQFIMRQADDFTQLMTAHKEFAVCHSAIKLGILSGEYQANLVAQHVIFMAQNDNFDTLDIYNLLENRTTLDVCETLCSLVPQHTSNLKIVLQLIDIILDKFQSLLSKEKVLSLKKQRLGALCYRRIKMKKVADYMEYSNLLFYPLILIEQLIMNYQIHAAATLVEKHREEFAECDMTANLDNLIMLYIGKALYFEGAKKSDTRSGSTTVSTISRVSSMTRRKPLTVFNPPFRSANRADVARRDDQFPIPDSPAKWVDDKKVKRCQICKSRFNVLVRKHHCRWCGRVLCDKCAPSRPPTSYFGASVRLCSGCFTVVQEGRYAEGVGDITEDMNSLYNPPFEVLSTNATFNLETRDSFSFSMAPSSELCLYLSRMLSQSSPPGDILMPLCEKLSEKVMDSVALDSERNFGHVLGVLETVLKEARNCFSQRHITSKEEGANIYVAYSQICRRLSVSDLIGLPSMKSLLKSDTLHSTYMKLLDKQHPQMAISLCTTAKKDPLGLWKRWGLQCLKAGDYLSAREKLEVCLKSKQYKEVIVEEIVSYLENCLPSFLAEETDITELVSDLRRKGKRQRLNSLEFDECVHYLTTFSSPSRILQFYIRHNAISRAAELAIKHDHSTMYEGIVQPLIKTGRLTTLFEYINTNRGQYQIWQKLLSDCCDILKEAGDLISVFAAQFFLKDYLLAANTAINMLRSELSVVEQLKYLEKAESCFKAFLEDPTRTDQSDVQQVDTRLGHIHLQRQILEFLKLKQFKDNNKNIHIFSSNTDKTRIVKELYKMDNVESLSVIRSMRETFSMGYMDTYQPIINHLLIDQTSSSISLWFPRLLKILGEIPAEQTDQILLTVCADIKEDQKSFERILAIMKDDRTKIKANIQAGLLRNAYILAVNKKLRNEIVLLEKECEKQGNTQVREFCRKYLQHNKVDK